MLSKGPKYRQPRPINWNKNFSLLMDATEEYARRWTRRENAETDAHSEWVKSIRILIKNRITI